MKKIETRKIQDRSVNIPGSKSISHRMIILASLANGKSKLTNVLKSEDILLTISCLKNMGAKIEEIDKDNNKDKIIYQIQGFNGLPHKYNKKIYLGNSGTSMRLLAGIAALGNSEFILTGDKRMCQRPMTPLIDALKMAGVNAASDIGTGTPPVKINGKNKTGGKVEIDCSLSSQYLSSLLMIGCYMEQGLEIALKGTPVSTPYIDLTIAIMKMFNVEVKKKSATEYIVLPNQKFISGDFTIEPDLSNAGYFWAAGAICKQKIKVLNVSKNSLQGDLQLAYILEKMGCSLAIENDGISICGNDLNGIEVDMSDSPDAVPALAVTAAYATGATLITNVGHLREKECDRIDAVANELKKMQIHVETGNDWIKIHGGSPVGAHIKTYNDHRIAMAFAIAGLVTSNIVIENENCVAKSFPSFWDVFESL
ncbi:MAG: 3-phosphoshikimate 1-carboxyvinyltransferase [Desulfobacteraceae bacterium]|nr:3-phosphoshikimate 1-carboxyvinyltransferase [Desulfobacteraceae bacterium]